MLEHEGTWDRLKGNLEKRLSPQVCATWISQTRCIDETDRVLKLGLPDAFSLNWVRDHYADVFEEELRAFSSKSVAFALDGSNRPAPATAARVSSAILASAGDTSVRRRSLATAGDH